MSFLYSCNFKSRVVFSLDNPEAVLIVASTRVLIVVCRSYSSLETIIKLNTYDSRDLYTLIRGTYVAASFLSEFLYLFVRDLARLSKL